MKPVIAKNSRRDNSGLNLNERAVLHHMLMSLTKDGLFCQKPSFIASELCSTSGTICRITGDLVKKGAVMVIESDRRSETGGYNLPTIYKPIPPVEWAPIPPVKQALIPPVEQENGLIPPVEQAKSLKTALVPNGTLEAITRVESIKLSDMKEGYMEGGKDAKVEQAAAKVQTAEVVYDRGTTVLLDGFKHSRLPKCLNCLKEIVDFCIIDGVVEIETFCSDDYENDATCGWRYRLGQKMREQYRASQVPATHHPDYKSGQVIDVDDFDTERVPRCEFCPIDDKDFVEDVETASGVTIQATCAKETCRAEHARMLAGQLEYADTEHCQDAAIA